MYPRAKIYAIARDEDTLRLIYRKMQENLLSIRENGQYISQPAGLDDWVGLETEEFSTSGYMEREKDKDYWDKMLKECGNEIGEDGAVFVVFSYDENDSYYEFASTMPFADTIYSDSLNLDRALSKFRTRFTDIYSQGRKLFRWFESQAGYSHPEGDDAEDNHAESDSELTPEWSKSEKESYVVSVSNVGKILSFPSTVENAEITGVADKFEFAGETRKKVEEIVIPEGYVYIGEKAFSDCLSLRKITLPSTLKSIGESVFRSCPKLESIVIPGSLKKITRWAFRNCMNLKELQIEKGVKTIELAAFAECVKLTDVIIPDSVKKIETAAFEKCSGIKNVTIPKGTTVEGAAFKGCNLLADSNGMVIISNMLLDYVGKEETVVIPDGITEIGASAFNNNMTVREIVIPDSVIEIGPLAFKWCSSLESFVIPNGVKKIWQYTFCHCRKLKSIKIPDGVTEIGKDAFIGCYMLKTVDLPESIKKVDANAFSDRSSPSSNITIVIRNPDIVMHKTCLEGCKEYTIYAPEGSPAAGFSPSHTRPLQEYGSKK